MNTVFVAAGPEQYQLIEQMKSSEIELARNATETFFELFGLHSMNVVAWCVKDDRVEIHISTGHCVVIPIV